MKKILLLFFLVTVVSTQIISCNSSEDIKSESIQELQNSELSKLFNSIDSLHNVYTYQTKTSYMPLWSKRILCTTVDACGAIISIETGPVGSLLFSALVSYTYEDYLNYVENRLCTKSNLPDIDLQTGPPSLIFPSDNLNFIDSIGHYHNQALDSMRSDYQSFVDPNGKIDYNECFEKVIEVTGTIDISKNIKVYNQKYFKYFDSVIKSFSHTDKGDIDKFLSIVFNNSYYELNYDSDKTALLQEICEKIIYNGLFVEKDQLAEYGDKVNGLIINSNVDDEIKDYLKIANNVTINSSLYWYSQLK